MTIEKIARYEESIENDNVGHLVDANLFLQGMRNSGYKSSSWALCELIDNAIDAQANRVHIFLNTDRSKNITHIAVVDDGIGMRPTLLRHSLTFGGGHKAQDRADLGRYGFGLPASTISIGTEVDVFSSASKDSELMAAKLHIMDISTSEYTDESGNRAIPEPTPTALPDWLLKELDAAKSKGLWKQEGLNVGTAVVIGDTDEISWARSSTFKFNVMPLLASVYFRKLFDIELYCDSDKVEPVDPVFLEEGCRDVRIPGEHSNASPYPQFNIEVPVRDGPHAGEKARVTIRSSAIPADFALKDKTKARPRAGTEGTHDYRQRVISDNVGILTRRNGRLIDQITHIPTSATEAWPGIRIFQNNARYWQLEIDFPAALDREFGITTNKQNVVLSRRMWDILIENKVSDHLTSINKEASQRLLQRSKERTEDAKKNPDSGLIPSIEAYGNAKNRFDIAPNILRAKTEAGETNIQEEAEEQLIQSGVTSLDEDFESLKKQKVKELKEFHKMPPHVIKETSIPEGPFYLPKLFSGQTEVLLNTWHAFYTDLYLPASFETKQALECLLLAMSDGETEAGYNEDYKIFYREERRKWSAYLQAALETLPGLMEIIDQNEEEDEEFIKVS